VVNVLSRLNAQSAPATAATHLKAQTPPLADTARYDQLRDEVIADVTTDACADTPTEEARHEA